MPGRDPKYTRRELERDQRPKAQTDELVGPWLQRVATSSLSGRYDTNIHLPAAAVQHALDTTDVAVYASDSAVVLVPLADDPNEPVLPLAGEDGGGES